MASVLLGYVISGRPPTAALIDLVRRWGKDVQFQTHDNGWIIFSFPSLDARAKVLSGGPYLVYGYHLFLKEMPRCFRFKDEDMNALPSWVQVHGLPPDCWNHYVLSNIGSEIGCSIHMDLLTYGHKRVKYARVLIEMNVAFPRTYELEINLPFGAVKINFVYEHDISFYKNCNKAGHGFSLCPLLNCDDNEVGISRGPKPTMRSRSKSVTWCEAHLVDVIEYPLLAKMLMSVHQQLIHQPLYPK